ncbi:MAG: DUF5719 family protein [Micrococcales bacterium]
MIRRISAVLLVSAAIVVTVVGAPLLKGFEVRVGTTVVPQVQQVTAKNLSLVCPGAALASGGVNGTKVGQFQRLGSAGVDYSSRLPAGVTLETRPLTGVSGTRSVLPDTAGNQKLSVGPEAFSISAVDPSGLQPQGSGLVAAQSFQLVKSPSFNGLLGANCQRPTVDHWLIGANTTVGREALLLVVNPNPTDASVSLELYGSNGKIQSGGNGQIAVAAFRYAVVPLAGLAPQDSILAVHLTASGASIASWVQQKTVRGTLAAGADLIAPVLTTEPEQVIPGLFKRGTKDATGLIKLNPNYQDLTPNLALFVPGTKAATITAQVVGADAKTFGTVVQTKIEPGRAALVPLTGLKDGNYSIFIKSDQQVLSAALLSRTNTSKTPNTDFTWLPAVDSASGPRTINVPKSGISKLSIANPTESAVDVAITNVVTGATQNVTVGRLTSAAVGVDSGSVVRVQSTGSIASTLIVDIDWQLTALGLTDYRNLGGKISVTLR